MAEVLTTRSRVSFDPRSQPLTAVLTPTTGASTIAQRIQRQLEAIGSNKSPTLARSLSSRSPSTEERLHDALGAAKIALSQVSMHLNRRWREKLFHQLDSLLDADSWDEADKVLENSSFATFLRMIIYLGAERRPALGISYRGHLLADWTVGGDSLTIEFLPRDEIRWVLLHQIDGERESAAGQTQLFRLGAVLAPYDPDRWFKNADQPEA